MKKKLVALILLMAVVCTYLASCGEDENLPEGMQLVRSSDTLGYTFYAPEGWTVCNVGDMSAAYVSTVNQTSVSLAPIDMSGFANADAYFRAHLDEFPYEITLTEENQPVTLGNATSAVSYVYTFTYNEISFRTFQVLGTYEGQDYIFTYTSNDTDYAGSEETYYAHFFADVQSAMQNLIFRAKATQPTAQYTTDSDGFALVSDKTVSGFSFYMAPNFTCDIASGIVNVKTADGCSVNLSEATGTGVSIQDYFETRKHELALYVTDLTVLTENEVTTFSNAAGAVKYEYTYTYQGVSYHVLQYAVIARYFFNQKGYVFTYTAPDALYATYLTDVERMAQKVVFE